MPKRKTVPVTPPSRVPVTPPASSGRNPNLGRQWASVTPPAPPAPEKNYTPIPWSQVNPEVRNLPDVPGIPKDHPDNAHLTGLSWMQIDWAHRNSRPHRELHVNEQGEKCPQCYPPRKNRTV